MQSTQVRRLSGSFGAEVTGVDLSTDVAGDQRSHLRELLSEHMVLVVRSDGPVGADEQNRLAAAFGPRRPLSTMAFLGELEATTPVRAAQLQVADRSPSGAQVVEDLGYAAEFDRWHTDSSFTEVLPRAAVLRAELLPPYGGDTYFLDMCSAYDTLSPTVREWFATLRTVHASPAYYKTAIEIDRFGPDASARFDAAFPPRLHPLVIEHPVSGRRALFANPVYTVGVEGMTSFESNAVLRMVFGHAISAEHMYRHHWLPGDLVVWDELVNLHLAPTDFPPESRKVVRVLAGEVTPTAPSKRSAQFASS